MRMTTAMACFRKRRDGGWRTRAVNYSSSTSSGRLPDTARYGCGESPAFSSFSRLNNGIQKRVPILSTSCSPTSRLFLSFFFTCKFFFTCTFTHLHSHSPAHDLSYLFFSSFLSVTPTLPNTFGPISGSAPRAGAISDHSSHRDGIPPGKKGLQR